MTLNAMPDSPGSIMGRLQNLETWKEWIDSRAPAKLRQNPPSDLAWNVKVTGEFPIWPTGPEFYTFPYSPWCSSGAIRPPLFLVRQLQTWQPKRCITAWLYHVMQILSITYPVRSLRYPIILYIKLLPNLILMVTWMSLPGRLLSVRPDSGIWSQEGRLPMTPGWLCYGMKNTCILPTG